MIHMVIGTRAQMLKMAPIMRECEDRGLAWRWIFAAQHQETMRSTVEFFELPDADAVMVPWDKEAKSLGAMAVWTARMTGSLARSRSLLAHQTGREHIVLTHGDTTTTVFGALLGRLTRTPVMHVESGLRSFSILNPFPEELNRLATFRLSQYYACPGPWALGNVQKYRGTKIDTGRNTQLDTLMYGLERIDRATVQLPREPYAVLSTHRFENVYHRARFTHIIELAERAAATFPVVMPLHPVTRGQLDSHGLRRRLDDNPRIHLMPRLEYPEFLRTIVGAEFVMTDGGGNQEELSYLGVPTLILREASERQDGIGENAVLGAFDRVIEDAFLADPSHHRRERTQPAERPTSIIVDAIEHFGGR
ncbi:UDP-N-acetylglucosamine 2-epimerase [Demequina activiva]|uniref:UDP-N-acetyl glucosamine 2-epimerase n=1 Tax=Demequina activiva TaxID=1582364 RepID=A0A919PZT2_9MICO|nr:UDP-N-acetylglucosamine 2-epimerase [Demequina activiva]GIG53685.1 UDP-N-acetyl glucosamine 2-epimerase [Demequina activiva]